MKKRIMKSSVIIALAAVIISIIMSSGIYFNLFEKNMINQSKSQADLIVEIIKGTNEDETTDILNDLHYEIDARITLIDFDGSVLYDSDFDFNIMDNHINREEIISAIDNGYGQTERYSDTANKIIYYTAIKVEDIGIVRIGVYSDDVLASVIGDNIFVLILLATLVLLFCYFFANITTKKIVKVIENYDVEKGEGEIYDELSTFILKINSQNRIINEQIQNIQIEKDKIQNVLLNITEGIIVCNKDGIIEQTNKESEEIFNIKNPKALFSSQVRAPELQKAMWKALDGEKQNGILEYEKKYYQYTIGPNVKEDKLKGAILIVLDITLQIKNQNARKEFSDNVTHELKTPLTSILGYAQLIGEEIAKPEDIVPFAKIVEFNAQKLLEIIDGVINLSAIEASKDINKTKLDITKIVKDVLEESSGAIKSKNISVNFKSKKIVFNADENQMYDMIRNLIGNAIKYNNKNGTINIDIKIEDNLIIKIEDTGIGINSNDLDKVFERFYVADTSRNKNISSTGLGLSIVKHIVENHEGKIFVKSKIGEGTIFTVTLPL